MPFEPQKITKEHILRAVEIIDSEEYEISPSTKYDVDINGKLYPPKEVMRFAHEVMNGEYLWEKSGGDETNKYFEKFGFEIVMKNKNDLSVFEILNQLKIKLQNDFKFKPISKKNYVWVGDRNNKIGNGQAHYEFIKRRNQIFLELHFEDKTTNKLIKNKLSKLKNNLNWFKWQKAESIRFSSYDMKDENIIFKLSNDLKNADKEIGDFVRKILEELTYNFSDKSEEIFEKKIAEFALIADEWFEENTWLEERYSFFNQFLQKENLETADWSDFQNMGNYLHCFNSLGIAKANALGKPNLPIERYREIFLYIISESDDIATTINNLYDKYKGDYFLPFFGDSSISELIAYTFPDKYTIYNARDIQALKILGITLKKKRGEKFGDTFANYNALIRKLITIYKDIVGQRTNSTLHLEIDQFFSWLYTQNSDINYWVFQGNPKVFDFKKAIEKNLLTDFTVSAYKNKIKAGDKVIIWLSGEKSGCYALAEVQSEPYEKNESPDDHLWKKENKQSLKANINITHNIYDRPILNANIQAVEALQDLKAGHQGTNFSATAQEYNTLLDMITNKEITKYWLYSPGENAYLWDEFHELGIMGLGWDELGDLNQYGDKKSIMNKLIELFEPENRPTNDALANFEFRTKINIGDKIIVKKGRNILLGVGEVTSDYYYDKNRTKFQKCRKVNWIKKGNWPIDHDLALKTLTDITDYETEHPDFDNYYDRLLSDMNIKNTKPTMPNYPLNQILYGPPGTGKTYNTVLKAAEIISKQSITDYDEALRIFKDNLHDKIEFITFHQNYSYEDFIQGLRPDTENNNQLTFERKDGIFLKIATEALFEYYKSEKKQEKNLDNKDIDLSETFLDFVDFLKNQENKSFRTSTGSTIFISGFTKNDNIEFKHNNSNRTYLVSGNRLIKLYKQFSEINDIKNVHNDIRDAIGGCNTTVYWVALNEFIQYIKRHSRQIPDELSLDDKYDEISYESKKKLLSNADFSDFKSIHTDIDNYVIIIDEINRANISRVFGELITLIEPDKRSHGKIPMQAKLPSGDTFMVPSNLYIIGTMNTADKSIALLDIALRRRFEFEAMYPNYELEKIQHADILQKINEAIIETKGHDFQIGHAYFMEENSDLKHIMNKKVIPLLLEYYMNDEEEVKSILSKAGLLIEDKKWPLQISGIK